MRIAIRLLATLTIAALLAPNLRWLHSYSPVEACSCPPNACMCSGHHHVSGAGGRSCMGQGHHCGVHSHDEYVSTLLSTLIYVPTEHLWLDPLAPRCLDRGATVLSELRSHVRVPEHPPRASPELPIPD
jgi:hypothetical protein